MTRVERRVFLAGTLGLLAAPLAAEAQQAGKVYRIGFLRAGEPPKFWVDEFRRRSPRVGIRRGPERGHRVPDRHPR